MKIKILLFLIAFAIKNNGQVRLDFNINLENKLAKISIVNISNEYYALPIDTTSLRPYFDNICLDLKEHEYPYPTLGLNIRVKQNDIDIESSANSEIPNDTVKANLEFKKQDSLKSNFNRNILSWQKDKKIKNFNEAKVNYYILNNILYLKPKQKIEFTTYFDLDNITNEKYLHSYFPRNRYKNYVVSLYYNIQPCAYNFLSQLQKNKFKKYKLFTGKLESNEIKLE